MEKITLETAKPVQSSFLKPCVIWALTRFLVILVERFCLYTMPSIALRVSSISWVVMNKDALHEAEGYAKSTGKLGVAVVTSGPGLQMPLQGLQMP